MTTALVTFPNGSLQERGRGHGTESLARAVERWQDRQGFVKVRCLVLDPFFNFRRFREKSA